MRKFFEIGGETDVLVFCDCVAYVAQLGTGSKVAMVNGHVLEFPNIPVTAMSALVRGCYRESE